MNVILCGFGSVGKSILKRLAESHCRTTIIDEDETRLSTTPAPTVAGDPTEKRTLISAGIMDADKLIAATESDVTNAFIILEAKGINSDLEIMSIADRRENIGKLYRAGADYVVPETVIGGKYIVKYALDPYIAEFLDKITLAQDIEITHIQVPSDSNLVGRKLKNSKIREKTGSTVIGISKDDKFIPNPSSEMIIKPDDKLIVIGKVDNIHRLNRYVKM